MPRKPRTAVPTAPPPRRARGFVQAGILIEPQLQRPAARRAYALARLQVEWREIAGAELAAMCRPIKLVTARGPAGGLLTLGVQGACGPMVQMAVPQLRARLEAVLGPGAVGRIQLAPDPGPPPASAPGQPAEPEPDPAALARVEAALSTIGDDALRTALKTLARNVLSRHISEHNRDP
mgnify:CR=1 FL=1